MIPQKIKNHLITKKMFFRYSYGADIILHLHFTSAAPEGAGLTIWETDWTLGLLVELKKSLTHLGEGDMIFSATLWTADCSSTVSFLLLVQPALQTGLVDPFRAAFTPAGAHPLCTVVVFLGGKTHPTVSGEGVCVNNGQHDRSQSQPLPFLYLRNAIIEVLCKHTLVFCIIWSCIICIYLCKYLFLRFLLPLKYNRDKCRFVLPPALKNSTATWIY